MILITFSEMKQSPNPMERNRVQFQRKKMVPRLKMEERIKGRLLWKMGNETLTNSHHHMQIMSTIPINIFCNDLSEIKVRVFEFLKKSISFCYQH